jgi:hypothetical protein
MVYLLFLAMFLIDIFARVFLLTTMTPTTAKAAKTRIRSWPSPFNSYHLRKARA